METQRQQNAPGWAPVHFGEDETPSRRRLTWLHVGLCAFVFVLAVYGGLLLSLVWRV